MGRQGSSHGGKRRPSKNGWSRRVVIGKLVCGAVLGPVFVIGLVGCSSSSKSGAVTSDPQAKVRLEKILQYYQIYTNKNKKPPANERAFKEYLRGLPKEWKEDAGIGEDVDSFLVSPGDGQKYHIQYGVVARPGAQNRAVAWEETGHDGKRYVALSNGYVQLCDEESFQNYKK